MCVVREVRCRVHARPSPITGALVVAEIVLREPDGVLSFPAVRKEILASCRQALPPHKVPVVLRQVASLDITASGKLARRA